MLKQKLQQKLLQKLSPQQIQLIKLLELPTLQLEQRIKSEMEENPAIDDGFSDEEGEPPVEKEEENFDYSDTDELEKSDTTTPELNEFSLEDYVDQDDMPSYKLSVNNYSKDDKKLEVPYSTGITFYEHLENQLGMRSLTDKQRTLAQYIIGNIDEDGYLRRELDSIVDDLAFTQNIETNEKELVEILEIVQDFDPAGVGARNLKECLLIQLNRKKQENPKNQAAETAYKILENYFIEFSKKHYDKIIQRMNLNEKQMKDAVNEVLKLNPKPGGLYGGSTAKNDQSIIPDFILENNEGDLILSLNAKNVPDLRINKKYAEMLDVFTHKKKTHTKQEKEAIFFVKQKLDSARWFIEAIRQRQNTLMRTMEAIISFQREYFLDGEDSKLRPMILKDVAEIAQLDISTISRVASSKFIQTHFGIFPLKYFFSEGLQTDSGEEVSTREIKNILKECIENESKKKPLTDDKLASILQEKGFLIARRTVAKYREQMNIQVARLRKKL